MEYGRKIIYLSLYENRVKVRQAGHVGMIVKGQWCEVQIYYRGGTGESVPDGKELRPVFVFRGHQVAEAPGIVVSEGMAMASFRTGKDNFLQSGKSLEDLEYVYLDGISGKVCGGRVDGQELAAEAACTLTEWMDTVAEYIPESGAVCWEEASMQEGKKRTEPIELVFDDESGERTKPPQIWTLQQCMEYFPEMKLPFDGVRRRSCRMTLEDMEHLPKEWERLKTNHFLLHGYYNYHHLVLVHLCSRYGERYALGVPGEYCFRTQYMAESFGFMEFAPLEPGKRGRGSFGYWYYYL